MSLLSSLLFDLVVLSFSCLIRFINKVCLRFYCDDIWLYLNYKGFWSSV